MIQTERSQIAREQSLNVGGKSSHPAIAGVEGSGRIEMVILAIHYAERDGVEESRGNGEPAPGPAGNDSVVRQFCCR